MSSESDETRVQPTSAMSRKLFLERAAAASLGVSGAGLLLQTPGAYGASRGALGSPRRGGQLIFARTADPSTLDPSPAFDNEAIWTVLNMFDCLYAVTPDGRGSRPWLAVSHDLSKDQRTWTFQLRPGVKFSDGKPLTADDVKFTLERSSKGDNGYINASIDAIDAPNTSTIRIHTKYPWGPLLGDLSLYSNGILPKDLNGAKASEFFKHPVGTGPFSFKSWAKGQSLTLERNPHYWQKGKPYLDSVTFSDVPDDDTRLLQLRGGQADIIEFPPFSAIKSLQSTPNVAVTLFPSTWVSYIAMNEERSEFADVHVRKAVAYAVDRQSIIKAVLFGHGEAANSFFSPSWAFYNKSTPYYRFDMRKARQELAASRFPHGFSATMAVVAGDSVNGAIAQIVQANLQPLGIKLEIQSYDQSAFSALQQKRKLDMFPDYYTLDIGDPDENTPWAIDPVRGGTQSLYTGYTNKQVMAWSRQAEQTISPTLRAEMYAKVQDAVAGDSPFVELYYAPYAYAYSSKVQQFKVAPTGNYHLEDVWLSA